MEKYKFSVRETVKVADLFCPGFDIVSRIWDRFKERPEAGELEAAILKQFGSDGAECFRDCNETECLQVDVEHVTVEHVMLDMDAMMRRGHRDANTICVRVPCEFDMKKFAKIWELEEKAVERED